MNRAKPTLFGLTKKVVLIFFLFACLFLSSCSNQNFFSQKNYLFAGNWQGDGVDSEGNEFTFAAKVIDMGNDKFRVLVLDKLDTQQKPMHIMDGVLKNNEYTYTADEGLYTGGGKLSKEMFEGYYKGPVDGKFRMWPLK